MEHIITSKKYLLSFLFLLISVTSISQIIKSGTIQVEQSLPCKFSWHEVNTNQGIRNFTTPPRNQFFAGPCLAFATISAIETMYKIEHNDTQTFINLSDTYLDLETSTDGTISFLKAAINSNKFNIPIKRDSTISTYKINSYLQGVNPISTEYYNFKSQAKGCINLGKDYITWFNNNNFKFKECGGLVTNNDYVSVGNIITIDSSTISIKNLKEIIISKGPIVLRVENDEINGIKTLDKFKNYSDSDNINYHAYTVLGWEDTNDGTKWVLKDSWQNNYGIFKTDPLKLSDSEFINLTKSTLQSNSTIRPQIKIFRVKNIKKNNFLSSVEDFIVNRFLQCPDPIEPIQNTPPELSNINVILHSLNIGGVLYSNFFVSSNISVDDWQWRTSQLSLTRNLIKNDNNSNINISPINNGLITVEVRAKKNNTWTPWKQKTVILSNGSSGGRN